MQLSGGLRCELFQNLRGVNGGRSRGVGRASSLQRGTRLRRLQFLASYQPHIISHASWDQLRVGDA